MSFPSSKTYALAPPCPGDAAAMAGWDSGVPARGLRTYTGTEMTLGLQPVVPGPEFAPFVGVKSDWLTDRFTLYVVALQPDDPAVTMVTPPTIDFRIGSGADYTTSALVSVFAGYNNFSASGRVVQVAGVLANMWTIEARVPPQAQSFGRVQVHVRVQLDRIGPPCCLSDPLGVVLDRPTILVGPSCGILSVP